MRQLCFAVESVSLLGISRFWVVRGLDSGRTAVCGSRRARTMAFLWSLGEAGAKGRGPGLSGQGGLSGYFAALGRTARRPGSWIRRAFLPPFAVRLRRMGHPAPAWGGTREFWLKGASGMCVGGPSGSFAALRMTARADHGEAGDGKEVRKLNAKGFTSHPSRCGCEGWGTRTILGRS
jgi:hypothetical protein